MNRNHGQHAMKHLLRIVAAFILLPAAAVPAIAQSADTVRAPIGLAVEDLRWVDAPPSMPAGAQLMVLEGNPRGEGLFTMRVKLPAGTRIEPHRHPRDERVTVISGSVRVGFGDTFDPKNAREFRAGSYYVNPAGLYHFLWVSEETVLQMTNIGPWELTYAHEENVENK